MSTGLELAIGLFPVLTFVLGLVLMDSYKLTPWTSLGQCFLAGVAAGSICLGLHLGMQQMFPVPDGALRHLIAPVTEESLKAIYLWYLLFRKKIGFLVDAAIYGATIGAGFACLENILYALQLEGESVLLWIVRGFGTALMHIGATALLAMMTKSLLDRHSGQRLRGLLPGWMVAILSHSLFNHFLLPPVVATLLLLLVLPPAMMLLFDRSEKKLKQWLGISFDSDVELLRIIRAGQLAESRIGEYLQTLRSRFSGETLADILCYLQIYVTLSIRAKGILLLKEGGFQPQPDPALSGLLTELDVLGKSIGYAGRLALSPVLRLSDRDLWQLRRL